MGVQRVERSSRTATTKKQLQCTIQSPPTYLDTNCHRSKKATPRKPTPKKVRYVCASLSKTNLTPISKESPKGKETAPSDYFATSLKSKPAKPTPQKTTARTSKQTTSYRNHEDDDELAFIDDENASDDIFAADVKKTGRRKDDGYVEIESEEEDLPKPKRTSKARPTPKKNEKDLDMEDASDSFVIVDDHDDVMAFDTSAEQSGTSKGKKRKSPEMDSDDDDLEPPKKTTKGKAGAKQSVAKKPRAPAKKKEREPESAEIQQILNSIPTVRAPTPPPKDPDAKFDWRQGTGGGGNMGPAPEAGGREIPTGAENCLGGLTFVFTGQLRYISREEGQELVKRHGGKITTAPSSKTNYVVLGSDAGPSKLRKIRELNIKTIDDGGLFDMIERLPANGGDGKAAAKNMEKKKAEEDKIRKDAAQMEKEERDRVVKEKEAQKIATSKGKQVAPSARTVPSSSQLWTSKYAPTATNQICGNKGQVEKIQTWLKGWPKAHKYNFEKRGSDGLGGYRAIILHGPPGIGKTTAAHLAAKLAGYDILESNASDTRSKKLVENGLSEVLKNNSLLGYFAGDDKPVDKAKKKIVLIMDEVDGMSAGDRGGVGALAKVCKKTDIPMILICNERKLPKMKPFDFVTFDMPFRRPTVEQVRSRIATICLREGLKLPMPVIDALIEGSNKDIRQIINMISTIKLDQIAMDYDQSKSMSKAWEKHVVLKPWDICHKLLGGGMFAPTSKATLNDKIELYFNDHEFTPLMIQENYLTAKPARAQNADSPKEHGLKVMRLVDQAAEAISDGDLVDRMIHGSQQQWGLMPTHAVFSTVRPCSFMAGSMAGQTSFTSWLGNNSKFGKLSRYVKEIQAHMRLRSSGDRHEIRQQYLPTLWTRLIRRLETEGKSVVEDVVDLMDSYFLTREDFDSIMELGVGPQDQERVHLETQTKATFTRM